MPTFGVLLVTIFPQTGHDLPPHLHGRVDVHNHFRELKALLIRDPLDLACTNQTRSLYT